MWRRLAAKMNNTTKILNDMNRNDSFLAIADKYSDWFEATSLGMYVYTCTKNVDRDEVWSPLMCNKISNLNLKQQHVK